MIISVVLAEVGRKKLMEFVLTIFDGIIGLMYFSFDLIVISINAPIWLIPLTLPVIILLLLIAWFAGLFACFFMPAVIIFMISRGILLGTADLLAHLLIFLQNRLKFTFPIIGQMLENIRIEDEKDKENKRKEQEDQVIKHKENMVNIKNVIKDNLYRLDGDKEMYKKMTGEQRDIIADFGDLMCNTKYNNSFCYYDEELLPHLKKSIIHILVEGCNTFENMEAHKTYFHGLMYILNFQKGVGLTPISDNSIIDYNDWQDLSKQNFKKETIPIDYIKSRFGKKITNLKNLNDNLNDDIRKELRKKKVKDIEMVIKLLDDREINKLPKMLLTVQRELKESIIQK